MAKLLEKALTGAIKERKHTLGTKQVVSSMKNSKLVVISQSVSTEIAKKIEESAQNDSVPLLHFNDDDFTSHFRTFIYFLAFMSASLAALL